MSEYEAVLELFKKFEDYSLEKNKIPKKVIEDIDNLKAKGILNEELVPPSSCVVDYCGQPAETMEEGNMIIVKCTKDIAHIRKVPKSDYIVYRMKISSGLLVLLKKLLGEFDIISEWNDGDICKLKIEKYGRQINILFTMECDISEEKLFRILSPYVSKNDFVVLIHKSTQKNYENIDSIFKKLPLGNIIFDLPLEDIGKAKLKEELEEWFFSQHVEDSKVEK